MECAPPGGEGETVAPGLGRQPGREPSRPEACVQSPEPYLDKGHEPAAKGARTPANVPEVPPIIVPQLVTDEFIECRGSVARGLIN